MHLPSFASLSALNRPGKDLEAVVEVSAGLEPEHEGDDQQGEDEQAGH